MVIHVNPMGFKEGEDGYKETNNFFSGNSLSYEEEVLSSKIERDEEEQLFSDILREIDSWNVDLSDKASVKIVSEEHIKELKNRINKLRKVKRFYSFGKGNPENYWDFFEMFDFICFIRVRHPEFIETLLKDYNKGRFSRK